MGVGEPGGGEVAFDLCGERGESGGDLFGVAEADIAAGVLDAKAFASAVAADAAHIALDYYNATLADISQREALWGELPACPTFIPPYLHYQSCNR